MNNTVSVMYTSECSPNPYGRAEARHFRIIDNDRLYFVHGPDYRDGRVIVPPRAYRHWEDKRGIEHLWLVSDYKTLDMLCKIIKSHGFEFPWFIIKKDGNFA